MPTLKDKRATALKEAEDLLQKSEQDENGGYSADVQSQVDAKFAEIEEIDKQMEAAKKASEAGDKLAQYGAGKSTEQAEDRPAKSLGEHFIKSVGESGLKRVKNLSGSTAAAPAFVKANTDTVVTGNDPNSIYDHWLTDVDTNFVREYRRGPVVADLLGVGSISGSTIKYLLEGGLQGTFTTVAEAGQKPQISYTPGTEVTDSVKKLAAWFDVSDEMLEDLPFFISEINNRALYELAMVEEAQLLNGNGTGSNLLGLLNREGIQEYAVGTDSVADGLFKAAGRVSTATGLQPDALVIHPMDYQELRLSKDGNDQYFGGGFFQGQYGNGGVLQNPPVWGLNTVVSPVVEQGTAIVGALKQAATVYRKGGVRVESTNSDQGKFTQNIVTTRIEERIGLAVRRPAAVVKVDLGGGGTEG